MAVVSLCSRLRRGAAARDITASRTAEDAGDHDGAVRGGQGVLRRGFSRLPRGEPRIRSGAQHRNPLFDKPAVFAVAFRVLCPGISDVVADNQSTLAVRAFRSVLT